MSWFEKIRDTLCYRRCQRGCPHCTRWTFRGAQSVASAFTLTKLRWVARSPHYKFLAVVPQFSFLFFILPSFENVSILLQRNRAALYWLFLDDESLVCILWCVSAPKSASSLFGAQVACWWTGLRPWYRRSAQTILLHLRTRWRHLWPKSLEGYRTVLICAIW